MLFNSIPELQQYTEVNTQLAILSLKPSIVAAEAEFIKPVLGTALYTQLNDGLNQIVPSLNTTQLNLLAVVRQALAPYILYIYTPKAEVNFTDGGLRRQETQTSKSAYQNQVRNLRLQLKREGDQHTEYLLEYLEANKADFASWTDSEAYKRYKSLFIKTGAQFDFYFTSASPWRNYMAMRPTMRSVEEQVVKGILGNDYYAALKAKDKSADPGYSEEENELLEKLKNFIANLTIVWALPKISVSLDERGLTIYSEVGRATTDDDGKRGNATAAQIDHLLKSTQQAADRWLTDIKTYLAETASETVFTEYYAWQQEINPTPEAFDYEATCGESTYGLL